MTSTLPTGWQAQQIRRAGISAVLTSRRTLGGCLRSPLLVLAKRVLRPQDKNLLGKIFKFQKFQLENLVDFEKCCKTHILLQKSVPIQPKNEQHFAEILPIGRGRRPSPADGATSSATCCRGTRRGRTPCPRLLCWTSGVRFMIFSRASYESEDLITSIEIANVIQFQI